MYQQHFHLTAAPFSLTPDTRFFCQAPPQHDALTMVMQCLLQGEGFIKIVGEVGTGKTLLCRRLLTALVDTDFVTAYLPNPLMSAVELPRMLARELGLPVTLDAHTLQEHLLQHFIAIHQQHKSVVLIIDEAQAMPDETLEALRLLTNLETETHKLLHVILLGQPELDSKLAAYSLRQLHQRIAFSYYLKPFALDETAAYIQHRLIIAGHTYGALFNHQAVRAIHQYSGGLPRIINILAHKALLVAYSHDLAQVNRLCVKQAIADTPRHRCLKPSGLLAYCRRLFKKSKNYFKRNAEQMQ